MKPVSEIDFRILQSYKTYFLAYIWIRRVRLIFVRILFAIVIGIVVYFIFNLPSSVNIQFNGSISLAFGPIFILALFFAPTSFLAILMNGYLQSFAGKNGFNIILKNDSRYESFAYVPSFRGKMLTISSSLVAGLSENSGFYFFTRIYKEGGLIRWRERKMDTVFCLNVPANLPHIVVNATANEKARRSNLSRKMGANWKFNFEGVQGSHYDVYAAPVDRVVALQIFTPDVLTVIYELLPTTDIEMEGGKIWFVQRYALLDADVAKKMFLAVERVEPELRKQIQSAQLIAH